MLSYNILTVIGAIGVFVIGAITIIINGMIKMQKHKSIDVTQLYSFAEEMKQASEEMRKDLQTIKEKVEAIDEMMKDI